jgi:hypothetical protein
MGERVKEYCRQYIAEHGRVTFREWEKDKERRALGLPSEMHIMRTLGTWPAFIEWCGIQYRRTSRRMKSGLSEAENMARIDAMLEKGRIDYESAFDYSAIPAIDRGIKRIYDWRTQSYYTAHVLELR